MKIPMIGSKSLFAALAVALSLAAGEAKAAFTYSVAANPLSTNFGVGGTSNYTITPAFVAPTTSPVLAGTQIINLAQTTQTSTRVGPPPSTDTTTIPITLAVTINSVGAGSGTITLAGNVNVTRSDTLGASSTFTQTSITPTALVLGLNVYTLEAPTYTAPTIQGGVGANGGMSITITENIIPEPASVVMMGTSVLALGGLTVLRRRRQG